MSASTWSSPKYLGRYLLSPDLLDLISWFVFTSVYVSWEMSLHLALKNKNQMHACLETFFKNDPVLIFAEASM